MKNCIKKNILSLLTQLRKAQSQMGRRANDEGWEEKLNWSLPELLFPFSARKQPHSGHCCSCRRDKLLQKRDFTSMPAIDRSHYFMLMSYRHSGFGSSESREASFLLRQKMKAQRAAGGLFHRLTPLSSSRIQAQPEQAVQRPAQGGVIKSAVIGCGHMVGHTH